MVFEDPKESAVSLLEASPEREYSNNVFGIRSLRERSQLRRPLFLHGSFILIHLFILALQIFLPSLSAHRSSQDSLVHCEHSDLYLLLRRLLKEILAPANEAISYVAKQYHIEPRINSPYVGEPRSELDAAWEALLASTP